jgi:protein MpaA
VLLKTRGNGHGIDLNRNLPTKDWVGEFTNPRYNPGPAAASEPENRVLMKFIEDKKPKLIISLHSWHPVLNVNGDILPEAEKIAEFTNYKIDSDIGYPTPGCLGTYTGLERGIGTLTYEIERGLSLDRVIKEHTLPIREALKVSAARLKKG